MLGESTPDNPVLAISLSTTIFPKPNSHFISFIKIITQKEIIRHKKKKFTVQKASTVPYSEITKPSVEQATMFQVQGSTELISQPSITCLSSLISLFTDIKAVTVISIPPKNQQPKQKIHISTLKISTVLINGVAFF